MKGFLLLMLLTSFVIYGYSQNKKSKVTGDVIADVNALLPEGEVIVEIMDGVKQTPREKELMEKFQAGVAKNQEWFLEQLKNADGEPMGYHPNLGLTKEEYEEFKEQIKGVEVVSTGQQKIEIIKDGGLISFKADGKLKLLMGIGISLNDTMVIMGPNKLKDYKTVEVTDANNGFRSKWKGYKWTYEQPSTDEEIKKMMEDFSTMSMVQYQLTIGQIESNGATFLSFKAKEVENGEKKLSIEVPLFLTVD